MKPKSNVDKEIYQAPTIKESIAAAVKTAMSETPQEETDLMLLQEALQEEDYKKWKRKNPGGSFKDESLTQYIKRIKASERKD